MKQFNNIYFNGCSFTAGGGLEVPSEEDIHAVWPVKGYRELGLDVYWKHNKEVAYPQRVSDELKRDEDQSEGEMSISMRVR